MRVLFTSDLHLNSGKPYRLQALERLLDTCKRIKTDILLISGDLFDSREEAEILRPSLRDKFSGLGFEVLAIPGNHDYKAYSSDLNFGNDLKILNKRPYQIIDYKDLRITAVPYENQVFSDIALDLKRETSSDKTDILMIHCSLDISSIREDEFGDEKRELYLPVSSKLIGSLGFDYVFAGHFHSRLLESKVSENTIFFYSGSPVSVTRKETGRRRAVLLDTGLGAGERINTIELDTFFHDEIGFDFTPGNEKAVLEQIGQRLKGYDGDHVTLHIDLKGLISVPEEGLSKELEELIEKTARSFKEPERLKVELSSSYIGVREAYRDPLFKVFWQKLEKEDMDKDLRSSIEQTVLRQFSIIGCEGP